jgi:hypothetical protein
LICRARGAARGFVAAGQEAVDDGMVAERWSWAEPFPKTDRPAVGTTAAAGVIEHVCAYLALSLLPVISEGGIAAGRSIFVPGKRPWRLAGTSRPVFVIEPGDVIANGAAVSCGALPGLPLRGLSAVL